MKFKENDISFSTSSPKGARPTLSQCQTSVRDLLFLRTASGQFSSKSTQWHSGDAWLIKIKQKSRCGCVQFIKLQRLRLYSICAVCFKVKHGTVFLHSFAPASQSGSVCIKCFSTWTPSLHLLWVWDIYNMLLGTQHVPTVFPNL